MKLPQIAINNHQFTIVVVVMLVLLGVISIFTMPYSEDPQVSPAGTTVIAIYPGANPKDMEQLLVDHIEEAVNELDDIRRIDSSMRDGVGIVAIEFLSGSDPDEKYSDVVEKVNSIRSELPGNMTSLDMIKWTVSDTSILQVAIVSESAQYSELEYQAEKLEKMLGKVAGVKESESWAYPEQEVRVSLDLGKISRMGLSLNQLFYLIQNANINIPGGNIDIDNQNFNIQTSGSYQSLDDIRNTIITSTGQSIVYLKDIADINFGYKDEEYRARFNGRRAVFVTATQKEGTNIFNVFKGIDSVISSFKRNLPDSMSLHYVFDQSQSVANRIRGFGMNLLQGIILVGIIVFLSQSFRSAIIVMLAIPISIAIGMGFVDMTGYGVQQMTIAGLVIALGILVDNAIVVTENTTRFMRMGLECKEASVKGAQQIAWAIVSATATTVLAFLPIAMMQDITGDFIRSMPLTVIYTLSASLFIALTFTPYLCSKFLKPEENIEEKAKSHSPFSFIRHLSHYTRKFQDYIIRHPYRRILNYALSHPLIIIFSGILALGLSIALAFLFVGVSFFPKAEKPQIVINISTPQGTSLDRTDEVARYVESVICSRDELEHCASNVGHGNPRIYYNIMSKERDRTHAQLFIQLKKYEPLTMAKLLGELRKEFDDYPDARIDVKELEQGPPVEAPIAIRIIGEDLDILRDVSRDVEKIIASNDGAINVDNPLSTSKTDLHVNINREKAGMLGVELIDIDRTVRASVVGIAASQYRDNKGEEYDIVLRLPVETKTSLSDFDDIFITSAIGAQIPLRQVASLEFRPSPEEITHYNLDRSVTVTADVLSDYSVSEVTEEIVAKLDEYRWMSGYRYEVGGEAENRERSFGGMEKAIIIAMIGIFAVLILQFRSFSQPFIVFAAIPLAVIGSIIALLITGYTFSFTAFIGLTSLVGIVVNNAIILVEYTNQLRQEGMELVSALKEAGETRFRPIIFTTATTVGGLLPLTLAGGTLWAPMGWTIIGGLTFSTILTLVVVPVLYKMLSWREMTKPNAIESNK